MQTSTMAQPTFNDGTAISGLGTRLIRCFVYDSAERLFLGRIDEIDARRLLPKSEIKKLYEDVDRITAYKRLAASGGGRGADVFLSQERLAKRLTEIESMVLHRRSEPAQKC